MRTVNELVDRIESATGQGRRTRPYREGYMLCCPAHNDKNPSLNVVPGRKRSFVTCYAGCTEGEILEALSLQPDDVVCPPPESDFRDSPSNLCARTQRLPGLPMIKNNNKNNEGNCRHL